MSLLDVNVMLGRPSAGRPALATPDDLLREMDRVGIEEAVVYSAEARYCHPLEGNWSLLKQIEGHRDRLHPCWLLLPSVGTEMPPAQELLRQMKENGVRAARLLPGQCIFPLSEPVLRPLLEALASERIATIIDLERAHWSENSPWSDIFAICEKHPDLPVILLRECGSVIRALYHLWHNFPNLYLETSYMQTARSLEEVCERFGAERLLFGNGLPEYDPGGAVATVHGSALTPDQRADIAGNNARRLLGLEVDAPNMDADWPLAPGGFRVWDCHSHLGPWYRCPYAVHDVEGTVRRMDEIGIERTVISDIRAIESEPTSGNARIADAAEAHPGRIYGYLGFAPWLYGADVAAAEKLLDRAGIVGIKLHCHCHDTSPDAPEYRVAYELAHERGLPVLTHGLLAPDALRKTLDELPNMTYVAAHYAALPPEGMEDYIAIARDYPNFVMDSAGSQIQAGAFARLLERVPVDQVMFGCDFGIMDFPCQLGRVLHADISDEAKQKVLYDNAARIYGKAGA